MNKQIHLAGSRQNQNMYLRKYVITAAMLASTCLGGCAPKFIPPKINYDNAVKATLLPPLPSRANANKAPSTSCS